MRTIASVISTASVVVLGIASNAVAGGGQTLLQTGSNSAVNTNSTNNVITVTSKPVQAQKSLAAAAAIGGDQTAKASAVSLPGLGKKFILPGGFSSAAAGNLQIQAAKATSANVGLQIAPVVTKTNTVNVVKNTQANVNIGANVD